MLSRSLTLASPKLAPPAHTLMTQSILLASVLVLGIACSDSKNVAGTIDQPPPSGPIAAGTFNARSVVVNGTTYKYQVWVPSGYASSQSWPIIVALHGSGEKGSDNQAQINVGLGPIVREQAATFPAIVLFPQMPSGEGQPPFTPVTIAELDQTAKEMKVDPAREYITGFSAGGIELYKTVSENPTRFAAAVPVAGTICLNCGAASSAQQDSAFRAVLTPMRAVPTWVFHGSNDGNVPVQNARLIVQILTQLGTPVRYTEYPGQDHDIRSLVYSSQDLYTWLFAQHR